MSKQNDPQPKKNQPEVKFGPYPGGIGIAVWLNTVETNDGPRKIRAVTLSPRRYRDAESGDWRDSGSYRPSDIPALLFGLQKAQEYILTTPVPGSTEDDEPADKQHF